MKVTTFLTEGFETVEALAVVDILRRAGITVDLVSVSGEKAVKSAQGVVVNAEYTFDGHDIDDTDVIFLPGGPGHKLYEKNDKLIAQIRDFNNKNKYIAAICAAPSILGRMGILEGKNATCFPGFEGELKGAKLADVKQRVVTDGNIITSRGMGTSVDLGLELVKLLAGEEKAEELAVCTQYR